MVWWQALVLAIVPAALTAGALLLQSTLTRRHETARHWSEVRFQAYAALWRSFHLLLSTLGTQVEAARDAAASDRLTVTLATASDAVRPIQQQMSEAWLVSGDRTRDSLLRMTDLAAEVVELHGQEVAAGRIVRLHDELSEAFDDYVKRCRQELALRV